ncbi:DUF4124 domain-containing protein [Shewanella sp. YIC-542]|uniref:DUF4124 domain-containing protein n=1 Tax=Shewanella mytili TaxID=3377111 RepID=UPI00398E7AEB
MIRIGLISALISAIGLAIYSPIIIAGDIYQWVDEHGVTHYSQQPPAGKNVRTLNSKAIEPEKIGTVAPVKRTALTQPSQAERDAAAIKARDQAQAQKICENARFSLDVLQTHTRLQQKDVKTGQPVQMTEEERQAAIATQQERIRLFCTPAKDMKR